MFKKLREAGVLGMNRRLGEYILPFNKRSLYPLVDSKIETYYLAKTHNIAQPEHYFHVKFYGNLDKIEERLNSLSSFVVKPSRGAMGNGILIVNEVDWNEDKSKIKFHTSKGEMELNEFKYFISDILSGMYSLSGQPDEVIIQEKLYPHPVFEKFIYKGIPDIRVIVFRGYPVMGMIRCPTELSRGRANLHQGAVGCGLNISDGKVCDSIFQDQRVTSHPDTGFNFSDLVLPEWESILKLSSRCYDITGMGYLGVDVVLDEKQGPLLLEMNARPGLSIQTANMRGLVPRLKAVENLPSTMPFEEKVLFSMKRF